jgi:hypothetical protein
VEYEGRQMKKVLNTVHKKNPPSPGRADFFIMMGCTPETASRHSVCNLRVSLSKHTKEYLVIFFQPITKAYI